MLLRIDKITLKHPEGIDTIIDISGAMEIGPEDDGSGTYIKFHNDPTLIFCKDPVDTIAQRLRFAGIIV